VKQAGIANKDLLAIGLGPKKPMASNDTAEGRAKNRRVEAMIPTNEALQQLAAEQEVASSASSTLGRVDGPHDMAH
jgi:OOP family OmpA-OmpF porin